MTKVPYITLLVGLPGVGKSTYVNEYKTPDSIVLSTDAIVESMCNANGITYDQGFKLFIDQATHEYNKLLATYLAAGNDIVIDRTNLSVTSRRKILARVPKRYKKYAAFFPIPPEEEWKKRLASRPGKCIPQSVLDNMLMQFQMPTVDEGFDAVFTIA